MKTKLHYKRTTSILIMMIAISTIITPKSNASNQEWKSIPISNGIEVFKENSEFMWMGSKNPPLNSDYPELLKFEKSSESIVEKIPLVSRIKLLEIDSKGNLWIVGNMGSFQGMMGVSKYDGTTLSTWNNQDLEDMGFPTSSIRAMKIDKQDNIWFGLNNGSLIKFDGSEVTLYSSSNSNLPSGVFLYISSIEFDIQNNVWVSIYNGGIAKFENDSWTVFNENNSELPTNAVREMKFDSQDNLWLATDMGLAKYENNNWTIFNKVNSELPSEEITEIDIDLDGNIWFNVIGSWGLFKYDGSKFTNFATSNSELKGNDITSIYVDSYNNKWLGVINFAGFIGVNLYNENGVNFDPVHVEESVSSEFILSPNPSSDFITISFEPSEVLKTSEVYKVHIFDMLGIEVGQSSLIDGNNRIDVSHLPAGVYFIRFGDKVEKFVKM